MVNQADEKPVALVDMDGTLCDYHNALQRDMTAVMEDTVVPQAIRERIEGLVKSKPGWYRNLKPLPIGIAIYKMLREIGFQVVICSKGSRWSKNSWTEKMEWVEEHLDGDVLVNLTQVKQIVYGRVFVDDYPSHFLPWMNHRPRGIVIVPDQTWNQDLKNDGSVPNFEDRIHRVRSLEDVQKIRPVLEKAYLR